MSSSWQETQVDTFPSFNYIYVALITLWVYDYILCLPDTVNFLANSRWGLSTFLYIICSHLPLAFMLVNMLVVFQPDAPLHLCRSYNVVNIYIGVVTMTCAECIFVVRAYAVWERGRWFAALETFAVIAYLVPITISLQQFNSRVSEPCWIPGVTGHLDTETSIRIYVAFGLLAMAELQTFLLLWYRVIKGLGGWGMDNRLMRGLMKDNLLYCSCGFAFSISVIVSTVFFPFTVGHMLLEFECVVQALLVTRMHRNFWRSDRAFGNIPTDISLTTWMIGALNFA
ncbi:uncharacterized protein HD556DRAFT_478143 [Suillus plorans]|uniref:DUF6533 domain-containing protein n=1 Tax=Suillus plorans TaxID=116603 RepID=A0A9P7J6A7_9AGAM|nr:uncharacterized protein HD556DRAFT_478143 [Suillus plorans]KAG1804764.1 hypothetical protein HD556DRAFT_478143 [Suillus plorans]